MAGSSRLLKELSSSLKTESPGRGRGQSERGTVDSLQQELSSARRTRNAYRSDMFKEDSDSSSSDSSDDHGESFRLGSRQPSSRHARSSRSAVGADEEIASGHRTRRATAVSSSLMEARGGVDDSGGRPRRSGRQSRYAGDTHEEEPTEQPRRSSVRTRLSSSHEDSDAGQAGKRSLRSKLQAEVPSEQSAEESEEFEEEAEGRKYSLRDRGGIKRETMNIQQLGGDGGAYKRSASKGMRFDRDFGSRAISYKDPQARIRLGGRLPSPESKRGSKRHRSGRRRHHHRERDGGPRKHFDSSSESSSSSGGDRWKKRPSSNGHKDSRGGAFHGGFGGEEDQFSQHERHRQQRELDSIQPLMGGGEGGHRTGGMGMGGSVLDSTSKRDITKADATPVGVDPSIGFHSVGGLDGHIRALKEMVVLPLIYPDLFSRFDTQPPRGVLFVGPPGTGKTLTARALVNSLNPSGPSPGGGNKPSAPLSSNWSNGKKVSFFMRKGADCLSKWVGEGERQLRLLFEQAKRFQPSIIFFDEIDGLAPVRSAKQDQIHASIVSTLLALMDGLDSRGQIVVIGATNRPDAVDPALRRPGRFDRELLFPLPDASARSSILNIHTATWDPPLPTPTKDWIVKNTVGYCGADMKALCAEACLISLRRTFPQVYESTQRLELNIGELKLGRGDFAAALQRVVPASRRSNAAPGSPLEPMSADLLNPIFEKIVEKLGEVFPGCLLKSGGDQKRNKLDESSKSDGGELAALRTKRMDDNDLWISCLTDVQDEETLRDLLGDEAGSALPTVSSYGSSLWSSSNIVSRPRLMLFGESVGMGQTELANATLHHLEDFPVFSLEFSSLLADSGHFSPEQALVSRVMEASKSAPSVLYLPDVISWWRSATDSMRSALISAAAGMNRSLPVLWLSTLSVDQRSTSEDETRLSWLLQWLSGSSSGSAMSTAMRCAGRSVEECRDALAGCPGVVHILRPSAAARENLFRDFFQQVQSLPATIYAARKKMLLPQRNKLLVADVRATNESSEMDGHVHSAVVLHNAKPGKGTMAELLHDSSTPLTLQDVSYIDIDEAKNYMRELRLFMRAALTEMFKEKKLAPLCRPVDPDQVPDYYDVITAPMDLDTIRTKVDEDLYPTYRCFYYDLEQIGFNAMTYNPLDIKDYRGKQIVHAAKSLLDMVETHAYNFKDRLGYDLFKRCDVIASCPELLSSASKHDGFLDTPVFAKALDSRVKNKADIKRVRSVMPRENETLYKSILEKHCEIKDEMGEDHPSFGRPEAELQKLEDDITSYRSDSKATKRKFGKDFGSRASGSTDGSLRRSSRGRSDGEDLLFSGLEEIECLNRKKRKSASVEVPNGDAADAAIPNDAVADNTAPDIDIMQTDDEPSTSEVAVTDTIDTVEAEIVEENIDESSCIQARDDNVPSESSSSALVSISEEDTEHDELMVKFREALRSVTEVSFDPYVRAAVEASSTWHYSDVMDFLSELQRVCRDFQHTADWNGTIEGLQQLISGMSDGGSMKR